MSSAHKTAPVSEIERVLVDLGKPLDSRLIKRREGPRNKATGKPIYLDYVEWYTVADMLNRVAPGWNFTIDSMTESKAGDWACAGTLTIAGVSRSNVGVSDKDGANGPKIAASDCLKRCATLFGFALELYRDEQQNHWAAKRLEATEAELAEREHAADEQPAGPRPVPEPVETVEPEAAEPEPVRFERRPRIDGATIKTATHVKLVGLCYGRRVSVEDVARQMFDRSSTMLTVPEAAALVEAVKALPETRIPRAQATEIEELCKQRGLPLFQTLKEYGVERAEDLAPETAARMKTDLLN
jgi:hypothetical protein